MEYLAKRWEHQVIGEERAIEVCAAHPDSPGFGFFFEPGTGKTLTAINTLRRLTNQARRELRTLIFCPPVVCANWKEELKRFSKFDQRRVIILHGDGKKRLHAFTNGAFDHEGNKLPGIFITNYETLAGLAGKGLDQLFHKFLEWEPEVLIVDESQKIKDGRAKRTQNLDILANPSDGKVRRKVARPTTFLLSGSPILNNPMDLFSQFLIMDGGHTFGTNFFVFRAKYFKDKNANMPTQRHFPKWVPKPGALAKIEEKIKERAMVVYKSECLDLPPLVKKQMPLEMTPKQAQHYEEMKRHLITYLEQDACVAQLAITKALRLMQIASGFIRNEEGQDISLGHNPKEEALTELLEDLAPYHKVLIWAVFKYDYQVIKKVCGKLGFPLVALHGGMSNKQRVEAVNAFNQDPKIRVLVGHPRSGGIGVNLTASDQSIYYSRNFSLEDRIQSEARNYRGGSEIHQSITHTHLVMAGTIEEQILKSLDDKTEIGLSILRNLTITSKSLGGIK